MEGQAADAMGWREPLGCGGGPGLLQGLRIGSGGVEEDRPPASRDIDCVEVVGHRRPWETAIPCR
jgi:hypothetical protein